MDIEIAEKRMKNIDREINKNVNLLGESILKQIALKEIEIKKIDEEIKRKKQLLVSTNSIEKHIGNALASIEKLEHLL